MKQGLVPALPFARLIDQWKEANWWMDFEQRATRGKKDGDLRGALYELGAGTGISEATIYKIILRQKNWIEFDSADRLVCFIDPLLWHTDEELSRIYRAFNFANLDLARPTHPDADPLKTVENLSNWDAAKVLGVSKATVQQMRYGDRRDRFAPSRRGEKTAA